MSSAPTSFGRYQIVRKLGEGGMASVYEAVSPFGVPVVLKVVHPEFARVPEVAERFRREGRIQYTLRHPNIVRVTDIVEENNVPALVIDFLDGEDLEVALGRRTRFTISEVISIGVKLLDALDAAHRHGFIHRDLKPSNIFLERQDQGYEPQLMDFGIAKISEAAAITREETFTGTPAYASPEQVASTRDVDSRSDLFSMGVVLWELLGGKQPWVEYMHDPYRVLKAVVKEELPPLPADVPRDIATVVARAMMKDPDARWQTAGEFRDALEGCAADNPLLSRSVVGPGKGAVPSQLPESRPKIFETANTINTVSPIKGSAPSSAELAEQARLVRTRLAAAEREKAETEKRGEIEDADPYGGAVRTIVLDDVHRPSGPPVATPGQAPQVDTPAPPLAVTDSPAADMVGERLIDPSRRPMADVQVEAQRRPVATMLPDSALPISDAERPEHERFVPARARFVDERDDDEEGEDRERPKKPEPIEQQDNALDHAIEFMRAHGLHSAVVVVILGLVYVVWDMLIRAVPLPNDFVIIEPGQFVMGSPLAESGRHESETPHRVTITHRFAIQNHEITREDFQIYNLRPPADFEDCGVHCPAVNVSWWDALEYANARSNQDELEECYVITGEGGNRQATWPAGFACEGYRLPTEAEWEYAARAGESGSIWGGFVTEMGRTPADPILSQIAVYGANSAVDYPNAEQCSSWSPVGTHCGPSVTSERPANPWGLRDMIGNAAEWVWDVHAPLSSEHQTDPTGPASGADRVARGCSYRDTGARCRLAARQGVPTVGLRSVGFRLARSVH